MKNNIWLSLVAAAGLIAMQAVPLHAQHDPYTLPMWRGQRQFHKDVDSTTLLYAFRNGQFNGHIRNFFMATVNHNEMRDYYANALGGGLRFETARFKGFQLGISGYFAFNVASNDLARRDPITNAANRYEVGLFDIENPSNTNDLDRLEELFLKYNLKKGQIVFGKQIIRSPFINPQDGRMRPTEADGLWADIKLNSRLSLEGGWLRQISPRSTVRWFGIAESIGVYPTGVNADGSPSGYRGQLKSAGVAIAHAKYKMGKHVEAQLMNQFAENLFNTAFAQVDYVQTKGTTRWRYALQYTRQDAVNDGGNPDPAKTYFVPGTAANIISARIGRQQKNWITSLNYTRITKGGRFLSPREWGRDPFFTFLPRERNEGLGDVHAVMAKVTRNIPKANLSADLGVGYYDLPDVKDFAHNKYGAPSYVQTNVELKYAFQGVLKGFDLDFLYVLKIAADDYYNDPKFIVNKANMSNINLVLNYHF